VHGGYPAEADRDRSFNGLQADTEREAMRIRNAVPDERQGDRRLGKSDVAGPQRNEIGDVHQHEHERRGNKW
jgi:hypothetical protein